MNPDITLLHRIQLRVNQPRPTITARPAFDATVRQADAIGACQVVNRYRCHGPVVRGAIAVGGFIGGGSVPALAAVVGMCGLAMKVVA